MVYKPRWGRHSAWQGLFPPPVRAVFQALQFSGGGLEALHELSDAEWKQALAYCDRHQLTLALSAHTGRLPNWVRDYFERAVANTSARFERIKAAYLDVGSALDSAGVEFLVLKGFAHVPQFVPDVGHRIQYDIDLFCPSDSVYRARDEVLKLGYEPASGFDDVPIDHLPAMTRKTGWQWAGDFYDLKIPLSIELHHRFWDPSTECLPIQGLEAFWGRRVTHSLEGMHFPTLDPVDAAGYAALHFLRHLLRGDARPGHAHEMASFLHRSSGDQEFWQTWREWHDDSLRVLEAISFRLAAEWFGACVSPTVQAQFDAFPPGVRRWFDERAATPLEAAFRANKDELWLHLSLLKSMPDKLSVLRRRLVPMRLPGHADRGQWRYLLYVLARFGHHAGVLAPALWNGLRWWLGSKRSSTSRISP